MDKSDHLTRCFQTAAMLSDHLRQAHAAIHAGTYQIGQMGSGDKALSYLLSKLLVTVREATDILAHLQE